MKKILTLALSLIMVLSLSVAFAGSEVQLYSTMTEADLDALITCFNEKYPDIEVIVTNGSAGELTTR
ncbi:MAG: hypothetical protein IKV90_03345, partial [Clostridia bacterium]|nr:hypothetical protein [Clostridia bacterium]